MKEISEKLLEEENLEGSPLGEPYKHWLSFPAKRDPADKRFQVKLKLDTPAKSFSFWFLQSFLKNELSEPGSDNYNVVDEGLA